MEFTSYNPVRIIGGTNCVRENARILKEMGHRALIITGAHAAKVSGALDDVLAALDRYKLESVVFDEMRENPLLSTTAKAGRCARACKADFIIAIGGGSVLDGARAASVFAVCDFNADEDLFLGTFDRSLPLVCIGTTAGTGSEVDNIAVITEDATGQKKSIKKEFLFARYAFADYRYTKTMDLRQTVSTGLDALCHCLESWFHTDATEPVVCAARRGIELIYPWLFAIAQGLFDPQDEEMRRELYYGALWGGVAIAQVGTGFPHPAGYGLTERGGLPHGIACALFEPAFLRHNLPQLNKKTKDMLLAVVHTENALCATIETLCKNNLTLSRAMCDAIVTRIMQSTQIKKGLAPITEQELQQQIKARFPVVVTQANDIEGAWTFGQ